MSDVSLRDLNPQLYESQNQFATITEKFDRDIKWLKQESQKLNSLVLELQEKTGVLKDTKLVDNSQSEEFYRKMQKVNILIQLEDKLRRENRDLGDKDIIKKVEEAHKIGSVLQASLTFLEKAENDKAQEAKLQMLATAQQSLTEAQEKMSKINSECMQIRTQLEQSLSQDIKLQLESLTKQMDELQATKASLNDSAKAIEDTVKRLSSLSNRASDS